MHLRCAALPRKTARIQAHSLGTPENAFRTDECVPTPLPSLPSVNRNGSALHFWVHRVFVGMSVLAMISDGYLDLYGLWSMSRA